jgi:MoaA/NifB/PqqE/SkfB family radical SAM enzyme
VGVFAHRFGCQGAAGTTAPTAGETPALPVHNVKRETRNVKRLLAAYLKGYPVLVSWQVTYACNFHCSFCSYWKEEVNFSREKRAREATLDDFRMGAEKLGSLGSLLITLAGGEPLLRPDFPEIVAILAQRHFPMATTNGWLVTEEKAKALWQAGLQGISVSLDFNDVAVHDENRGQRGAGEQARRAIQILSRARTRPYQRVNLMCVLNQRNLEEVEELIRFAAQNRASFMIQPYASIKNGNLAPVPEHPVSRRLLELKKRYGNFLSSRGFLKRFDCFYAERGIDGCRAGQSFFNIDNFLNVQKCVEFRQQPIGNLRDLDPQEMILRLRGEHRRNVCKACWYNCRGEVEGLYSLRGLAAALPAFLRSV